MNVWTVVGVGSLLWSLIELLAGRAWLHREIERGSEPTYYWVVMLLWVMLGVSCLIPAWRWF